MELSEIKTINDVRQWLREQDPWNSDLILLDEAPKYIIIDEPPIKTHPFNHYLPLRCMRIQELKELKEAIRRQ